MERVPIDGSGYWELFVHHHDRTMDTNEKLCSGAFITTLLQLVFFLPSQISMLSIGRKLISVVGNASGNISRSFHLSNCVRGFESFFDPVTSDESFTSGRAWTVPDLRRKVKEVPCWINVHLVYLSARFCLHC